MADKPTERGRRSKRFLLRLTPEEAAILDAKAALAGLPLSVFCRNAALGKRINSSADKDAIQSLVKVSSDQGRLGGLLKLWLSDRPGVGAPEIEVVKALRGVEELRSKIREAIARL